ncbi:MAG: regulatory protein RecX [Candidatus Berkelbacteria bacterium]
MKSSLDTALYFLKFRARTVFEIRQKLKSKSFSGLEIDQTIDVLLRNELLDDTKFAKMYVKDRNTLRPTGLFLLKMEMKKLGLSDNLIEDALQFQNEEELARRAIESKSRLREAEFEKKAQFLARRGFSTSTIMKVLER